jgi:hypothetical protein
MLTEREKAERWDRLLGVLQRPGTRDTYIWHLSAMRRAAMKLLANRARLPEALVRELAAYMETLDGLYLEVADGFADVEGVLNLFPVWIAGSVAAGMYELDTRDEGDAGMGAS